jgi:hypothetical protein
MLGFTKTDGKKKLVELNVVRNAKAAENFLAYHKAFPVSHNSDVYGRVSSPIKFS